MKNLFLSLVFLLIGSFAFANSNEVPENQITSNPITININNSVVRDYVFSFDENQLSYSVFLNDEKKCKLYGDFTVTLPNGEEVKFEGDLVIYGQTCIEFLKSLTEKEQ